VWVCGLLAYYFFCGKFWGENNLGIRIYGSLVIQNCARANVCFCVAAEHFVYDFDTIHGKIGKYIVR